MRGCEIKGLRWRDVDLIARTLTVVRATTKTDACERIIPLNANAAAATVELYRRAQTFGGCEADYYVFPACENGRIDPTRPQTTWRTAWRRLTRAILCPACDTLQNPAEACQSEKCKADIRGVKSTTAGLRFHDLRHHAITELAESQASDQTVMAIAGHVSSEDARALFARSHGMQNAGPLMLFRGKVLGVVMAQTATQTLCPPLSLIRK